MIVANKDEICSKANAKRIMAELGPTKKTIRFVTATDGLDPDHDYFAFTSGTFATDIVGSIEFDE